jgi:hypothetical protein
MPDDLSGIVPLLAAVAAGAIVVLLGRSLLPWQRNRSQPVLSVAARVVSRRTNVASHHRLEEAGGGHIRSDTSYYVTFQVESGDRLEFQVDGREYGMLAEFDTGKLTFRGTKYLGFERSPARETPARTLGY